MNALIGTNLAITTSKAQTTRHRILGILNGDNFQIVFSDTPGILEPKYKLQESMLKSAAGALEDADIIIVVTAVDDDTLAKDPFFSRIVNCQAPKIVVINKVDLSSQPAVEAIMTKWKTLLPDSLIFPLSAKHNFNVDTLLRSIKEMLPEGPAYFPDDQISDRFERFFASEIIREKILLNYSKEIPYSVEVEIEAFSEEPGLTRISALIHIERESQKGIIIGHKGSMLKRTGTMARKSLEEFLGKKVFLEMRVRVSGEWRQKSSMLKRFGY